MMDNPAFAREKDGNFDFPELSVLYRQAL